MTCLCHCVHIYIKETILTANHINMPIRDEVIRKPKLSMKTPPNMDPKNNLRIKKHF